jgi:iron(III) transport system ATP-binding protein
VILELKNISHSFEKPILKKVNLKLFPAEIIGLVGKSGAGKSSLLKIVSGNLTPDEGTLLFDSKKLPSASQLLVPGFKDFSMVNQDFKLDLYHTVEENIRESILFFPTEQRERRVLQLLKLFELTKIQAVKSNLISGGEQQRLAIARAISNKPKILLLDEPFGHLDANLRRKLSNHLLNLRDKEGVSIILVSHEGQDVLGLCDAICLLRNGSLSKKYKPRELYYKYKNNPHAFLFGPLNIINLKGEKIVFRPDEYEITDSKGIKLTHKRSIFVGSFYHNYFTTENHEEIILYSFDKEYDIRYIRITSKK